MPYHVDCKPKESGVLGVLDLPEGSRMPADTPLVRTLTIATVAALAVAAVVALLPLHNRADVQAAPFAQAGLLADAVAYLACAFLLLNRLAVSRSPAFAVLGAAFTYTAILMVADLVTPATRDQWIWAYRQAGLSLGLLVFVGADWHWAAEQRRAAENGYHSDNRIRYKRLNLDAAKNLIATATAVAVSASIVALAASQRWGNIAAIMPARTGLAIVAGVLAAGAVLALVTVPEKRTRVRRLIAMPAIAVMLAALALGSAAAAQAFSASPTSQLLVVRGAAIVGAAAGAAAAAALLLPVGHDCVFNRWLAVAAAANALDCAATTAATAGAIGWYPPQAAGTLAPLLLLGVLLYDAKAAVYQIDDQARSLNDLTAIDHATGLANLRSLLAHLEKHMESARHMDLGFAMYIIDVAGVKAANRAVRGHVGTDIIVRTARALRMAFAGDAVIGRIKGDDFAVVMPPGAVEDMPSVHARVALALRETSEDGLPPIGLYVLPFHFSASDETTAEEFLWKCQSAAVAAKKLSIPVQADRTNAASV